MKRMLLSLLAAVITLSGCGVTRDQSVEPLAAQQPNAGLTDAFGLKTDLDPARWKEAERTTGKLVLEYQPVGKACNERDCSRLTLSIPAPGIDGDYYRLALSTDFLTTTWCQDGLVAVASSVRQSSDFMVGGVASEYYVGSPCGDVQPRSFTWLLRARKLLIRFDETATGVSLQQTGLETALQGAVWENQTQR